MSPIRKEYPFGSIHKANGWEGQLLRAARWFDRLMQAESAIDAEDFLYTFFQNAHHLRDWSPGDKKVADEFINSNLATRICRDIANLTKHHELKRQPSQEDELSILREYAGKNCGWFGPDARLVVVTNHNNDGIVIDAREVGRECLRLWCDFLSPSEICNSIKSYFDLSPITFQRVMKKCQKRTELANKFMKPFIDQEKRRQSHSESVVKESVLDEEILSSND